MSDSEQGTPLTEQKIKLRDDRTARVHALIIEPEHPRCIPLPLLTISRITKEDMANLKTRDSEQEQQQ